MYRISIIFIVSLLSLSTFSWCQTPEEDLKIGRELASQQLHDSAFLHFLAAAEHGNATAMYETGYLYEIGQGTAANKEMANEWYKKAAHLGYPKASLPVGIMYLNAGAKDSALHYLEQAVDYDKKASGTLGQLYYQEEDYEVALPLFRNGAKAGDAMSMYYLGEMYYESNGVEFDEKEAVKWFQKAAKKGNKDAQQYLETLGYEDLEDIDAPVSSKKNKSTKKSKKQEEDIDQENDEEKSTSKKKRKNKNDYDEEPMEEDQEENLDKPKRKTNEERAEEREERRKERAERLAEKKEERQANKENIQDKEEEE